ncbi:MAG: hypothetical protein Q8L89_04245 [Gammaproteobacteria bacterium]|nr:hypothetical protein [Gammaproteobacteria bacterium]
MLTALAIILFIIILLPGSLCLLVCCWAIGLAMGDIITDIIRNIK